MSAKDAAVAAGTYNVEYAIAPNNMLPPVAPKREPITAIRCPTEGACASTSAIADNEVVLVRCVTT